MSEQVEEVKAAEPVPHLLLEWEQPSPSQVGRLAAFSVAAHVVLGIAVLVTSHYAPEPRRRPVALTVADVRRQSTPLVAPPSRLTQRAPNRGMPSDELNVASLPPRPNQPSVPAPGAAAPPRPTPRKLQLPDRQQQTPVPSPALPEAPAIQPGAPQPNLQASAPLGSPVSQLPAAPQIIPEEKPKIAFERPGAPTGSTGTGRIPLPKTSIEEIGRQVARGGGGGIIVGDEDAPSGRLPSMPVPVPGKMGSSVELLSDPTGVDFWPYLVKILSAVRRNWFAVIPESAHMGRTGRSTVRFTIAKDGRVSGVVIAVPSGTEAFDRAAIAGISASHPLPPLPADFKGNQIRLQFVFKYNIK